MGHGHPLEVMETVLDVADVAWNAVERRHDRKQLGETLRNCTSLEQELASQRAKNQLLKSVLEENLKILEQLSQSLSLSKDCPSDLFVRLMAAVDSSIFLTKFDSLRPMSIASPNENLPFKEVEDSHSEDYLVRAGIEEPNWWVWVTDEMIPSNGEECSEIDNENYVIVTEEQVVDGVANFLARCVLSNPKSKSLTPEELQKTVAKALGGMNSLGKMMEVWHVGKLMYCLSTWGLALAGLYRHRAVVRVAAKGFGASSKVIMKAL